jgi:hypothetical protein
VIQKGSNMLSNKIIADRPLAGNENRAHVHKGGRYQEMTPMTADGGVSGTNRSGDMPPGILGAPLNSDPHAHQRRSNNLSKAPFERPGSHYATENRRRIHGRGVDYK